MKAWLHSNFSYYTGTTEPEYGSGAIEKVTEAVEGSNPSTELDDGDYQWATPDRAHVETESFYVTADSGHVCFAQIIHSNLGSWTTTAQFTCRFFDHEDPNKNVWTSTAIENFHVTEDDKTGFKGDGVSVTLSADRSTYKIVVNLNPDTICDFEMKRTCPGFKIGKSGTTKYGTDLSNPWATMRHGFWPRATVEGTIIVKGDAVRVDGKGMFVHALQNGKPHHLASSWQFADYQGERFSAVMMQFITPPSYGSTLVNVGAIATDDKIVAATIDNEVATLGTQLDPDTGWDEPTKLQFQWKGATDSQQPVCANLPVDLGKRLDRVDVLEEIPVWLRSLVHGVSGTRPFVYQYGNKVELEIEIGSEKFKDKGILYSESTFIS